MAMVMAMVMAMGVERADRCSRRSLRPLLRITARRLPLHLCPHAARRACVFGIGCLALAAPSHADNWRITSSASLSETYTSNVNYSAFGNTEGDFATSVGPERLIGISQSDDRSDGVVTVWYWE